ncbi:MAG: type II toxin-antitoxin system RelB/DinJ family antitoxin [Deltaproteobacteria bacterium]|nr:type II toxin-antitoxin system RelB/DinJ family antitoxin [Deltaproteobacteria bacterium]
MANTATINARVDPKTKAQAVDILKSLGLSTSQAISLFFKQVIYTNGIPFELRVPNKTTVETFRNTDSGRDLHRVTSVDELAKELKD